jgi:hypothetical protein
MVAGWRSNRQWESFGSWGIDGECVEFLGAGILGRGLWGGLDKGPMGLDKGSCRFGSRSLGGIGQSFFPHVDHIPKCVAAHDARHLGRRRRRALPPPPGPTVAPFGRPHLAVAHQCAVQGALWGAAGSPAYPKIE